MQIKPGIHILSFVLWSVLAISQTNAQQRLSSTKTIAIDEIIFTGKANLFKNLPRPVMKSGSLFSQDINHGSGFILYRTMVKSMHNSWLKLPDFGGFATIYAGGNMVGTLDSRLKQDSFMLNVSGPDVMLDILVENNERQNVSVQKNHKQIATPVTLDGIVLKKWAIYSISFANVASQKFAPPDNAASAALYRAGFQLTDVGDTYLDMRGFGKGFAIINGHNIGKYRETGPHQTIYIPARLLKKGLNEIVVFDGLNAGHISISSLKTAVSNDSKHTAAAQRQLADKYPLANGLWNAGSPIIASVKNGRWGNPADWQTSDNVKNHGNVGGWCADLGGCLAMESGWDNTALIDNGKIYQSFTLPAGSYRFLAKNIATKVSQPVYIVVATGDTLPNVNDIATAIAYTGLSDGSVEFTIAKRQRVTIGFFSKYDNRQSVLVCRFCKVTSVNLYGSC